MKKLIILITVLFPLISLSQSRIDRQLDSLKNTRTNLQLQIRNIQLELQNINKKIDELEVLKKTAASTPSNTINAKVSSGGAILRDAPSAMSNTIVNIPAGANIQVFREQQNLYFKASYNNQTGYISYSTIDDNQEIDDFLSGKTAAPKTTVTSTTIIRQVDKDDPKYQKLLGLYGAETAIKIINGELWQGMSIGMVVESIGQPNSKDSKREPDGVKETWFYNDLSLNFHNGELKSWTKK